MAPHAFIIMGPQGSGKGTQADLLVEYLKKETGSDVMRSDTGAGFREFVQSEGYTAERVRESIDKGERQPVFLSSWIWTSDFILSFTPDMHIVIDASPRSLLEAQVLATALSFYKRTPTVFNLVISDETAIERLVKRARHDDTPEAIERRLGWYHKEVEPAVEYYRSLDDYRVVDIDAERSIEEIHKEIISRAA